MLYLFLIAFFLTSCGPGTNREAESTTLSGDTTSSVLDSSNHHASFPLNWSVKSNTPVVRSCQSFFDFDTPSSWGNMLIAAMDNHLTSDGKKVFYEDSLGFSAFIQSCNGFVNRDDEFKRNVWVWAWLGLAVIESTCNPGASNPDAGIQGTGYGFFQLPPSDAWRGRECAGPNIGSPENNIQCAVKIMNDHVLGNPYTQGSIVFPRGGSYWGPINKGWVRNWVKKHPACNLAASSLIAQD